MAKPLNGSDLLDEALKEAINLLKKMIEKADNDYKLEAESFIQEWADKGLMSYQVSDEIFEQVTEKLKSAGVSYLAFNNATVTEHVLFFPQGFAQHVESITLDTAREQDLLSEVSVDEISDLCYAENLKNPKEPISRYEVTVPNELIANRLRETLTKDNELKTVFSMTKNLDDTFTFTCTSSDSSKMNRAYFESAWSFAGRFAELNKKQEQYDLERQEQLKSRMELGGVYTIADPELDEKGNATGNVREKIEITNDYIVLYKNGTDIAEKVPNDGSENSKDTLQSWSDRQSRPIIIEENEKSNISVLLKERNPKIFLEKKDHLEYKQDKEQMYKIERKMLHCFNGSFNERAWNALMQQVEKTDNEPYKQEELNKLFEQTKYNTHEIVSQDLSSLDRVIDLAREEARANEKARPIQRTPEITKER